VTSTLLTILIVVGPVSSYKRPHDPEYVKALELLYDGSTDTALARLARLSAEHPEDPAGPYFESLALCWKIEQKPRNTHLDSRLLASIDRGLELTDRLLRVDPNDARTHLGRAGAFGVRSRFHLFRFKNGDARRDAIQMRAELMRVRELDPDNTEACFGLGLYDYYADVLPRILKLLRFLVGMPGGDKERGLHLIERACRESDFHRTEAQVQLYEIYAFYEGEPDRGRAELLDLRHRYPSAPFWGLKLAALLRDQLGLYSESVSVSREIIESTESGHRNYAPIVADMARLSMSEALLRDSRFKEARQSLEALRTSFADRPVLRSKTQLLLGRCLELEGDREAAVARYQQAASSPDEHVRNTARKARSESLSSSEIEAAHLIGDARRLAEAGRNQESRALYRRIHALDPEQAEALLSLAEEELLSGNTKTARAFIEQVIDRKSLNPPWLRSWAYLLLGHAHDLDDERQDALQAYEHVIRAPIGRSDFFERAEAAKNRSFSLEKTQDPSNNHINHD
jgi:tetratricopeptide (TPR) repeat protein